MKNNVLYVSCSEFLESVSAPPVIYDDLLNFFTKNEYVFLREGVVIKAYKQITVADSCRDSVAEKAMEYKSRQPILGCENGSIDKFKKNLDSLIDGYDSVLVQRMLMINPLLNFLENIQKANANQINACRGWLDLFFKRFVSYRVNRDKIYSTISFDIDVAFKDQSKHCDFLTYAKGHESQVLSLDDYIEIKNSIVSVDQDNWSESVLLNALGIQLNDLPELRKSNLDKNIAQAFLSEINSVLAVGTRYGYMPFLKVESKITLLELFSLSSTGSGVAALPAGSKYYMDFPTGLYFERSSLDGVISTKEVSMNKNQVRYIHLY